MRVADHDESTVREVGASGFRLIEDQPVGGVDGHEMEEETQHADALLRRILFLEGTPDMRPNAITVGQTVPEMLRADLALEYEVREALAQGVALCNQHKDFVTREILVVQLEDTEEDHAYWLEQQLGLIDKIGLQNYLQSQMKGGTTPHGAGL